MNIPYPKPFEEMPTLIIELAKKAGGTPEYSSFRGHFLPPSPNYVDTAKVDLSKFAELIINECYTWARENGGLIDYAELKAHFGVEK